MLYLLVFVFFHVNLVTKLSFSLHKSKSNLQLHCFLDVPGPEFIARR